MGWLFKYGMKRAELIRERQATHEWKGKDNTDIKDVVLASCYRGGRFSGVFYAVHERTETLGEKTATERWIEVTLMECKPIAGYGPSWGYKDMEASMGPGNFSCPLGYLDMVPEKLCATGCEGCKRESCSGLWERNWRANVRAYHAKRAAESAKVKGLKKGQIVDLEEGCSPRQLVIVSTRPLVGESGGRQYRIKPQWLA
jgi:hypothetical protein